MREFMSKWLGPVIMAVVALFVAVAMIWHGEDVATIAAVLAAVGLFVDNRFRMSDQNQVLGEIHENTNGKLDARIKDSVKAALEDLVINGPGKNDPTQNGD